MKPLNQTQLEAIVAAGSQASARSELVDAIRNAGFPTGTWEGHTVFGVDLTPAELADDYGIVPTGESRTTAGLRAGGSILRVQPTDSGDVNIIVYADPADEPAPKPRAPKASA